MERLYKAMRQDIPNRPNQDVFNSETIQGIDLGAELWRNDLYTVHVRRGIPSGFGEGITMTHLSIKRNDKAAQMDWRHMQQIKNQLVGEECDGVEIFPAESRLLDTSNQYHLWVFENPKMRFPFGFFERTVTQSDFFGNVQRPFEEKPADLDYHEERVQKLMDDIRNNKNPFKPD